LVSPIHHGVLFNLAEAYFREGQYDEAIKRFDDFIKYYSYHKYSDQARVRLALSYEIMEKNYMQTAELYKNAINRSSQKKVQYEAKVRLVGLQAIRKIEPTKEDKELKVFLTRKSNETFELGDELEQLLWLVRLRTYIKDEAYEKGLSYLKAIPITSMLKAKSRSFIADGVEIVSGLILKKNLEGKHHIVVRLWELYSKRYFDAVAIDPYINYIVGKSYLELGFYDSFEKLMTRFEKFRKLPPRSYPRWKKSESLKGIDEYIATLKLTKNLRLRNWNEAQIVNEKYLKSNGLYDFYRGVIQYRKGNNKAAVEALEKFITSKNNARLDDTQQSEFYEAYTESLHNLGKVSKFQKVVSTIIQQKSLSKNDNFAVRVYQRAYYLYLENLSKLGSKKDYAILEANSQDFIKQFQNSSYTEKVKYLLGLAYAKNLKENDAKKVFEEIISDNKISKSIKELARTELTLINLKNKKL
jgi:TolA-binding protein